MSLRMLAQAVRASSFDSVTLYSAGAAAAAGFYFSPSFSLWAINAMGYTRHGTERGSIAAQMQRCGQTGSMDEAGTLLFYGHFFWAALFLTAAMALRSVLQIARGLLPALLAACGAASSAAAAASGAAGAAPAAAPAGASSSPSSGDGSSVRCDVRSGFGGLSAPLLVENAAAAADDERGARPPPTTLLIDV